MCSLRSNAVEHSVRTTTNIMLVLYFNKNPMVVALSSRFSLSCFYSYRTFKFRTHYSCQLIVIKKTLQDGLKKFLCSNKLGDILQIVKFFKWSPFT